LETYVIDNLQDGLNRHERRIHDAGKRYAAHVKSTDSTIVGQAEGVFLQEMRDSVDDLTGIIRRRTPDPVVHANEFADAPVQPMPANRLSG
jgi:hypothetical protein